MSRERRAGFTLIEILVAISMVSLLSLAGLYAMRVGFSALDKTGKQLSFERRVLGTQRALEQMLVNVLPVRAVCHGGTVDVITRTSPAPTSSTLFFDGRHDALRLVSTHSLEEAARGAPRIIELAVIPGRQGEGVRLVVNEHLYWGPLSAGYFCGPVVSLPGQFTSPFLPVQAGPASFILADRMSSVRFFYRAGLATPPYYVWVEQWESPVLPEAIRVEAVPLTENDGRPLTIIAPLHVKRDFMGQTRYEDSFPRP